MHIFQAIELREVKRERPEESFADF